MVQESKTRPQPVLLVASDSVGDADLVKKLLSSDFENVSTSTVPEHAVEDFKAHKPDVLVLAFDAIGKAHRYYLGLYRLSGSESLHRHRTVLLCDKDELRNAYQLCVDGHIDDYVLFWPIPHDALRLPMSVIHAWRDLASKQAEGPSPNKLVGSARCLSNLPPLFDAQMALGTSHLEQISRNLIPHDGEHNPNLAESVQAARQWASGFQRECTPYLDAARSLDDLIKDVRPTVIAVDDDRGQLEIIATLLKTEPLQLVFASSGVEVLHILRKVRPDVILLDLLMPDLSGLQVLQCLKGTPGLAHVPVIIMTEKSERSLVIKCRDAGASGILVKPFKREAIVSKLSQVLTGIIGRFETDAPGTSSREIP